MLNPVACAKEHGFEFVSDILPEQVICKEEMREFCTPELCPHYGSCWSCPPAEVPFEECAKNIAAKEEGVLLQTFREGVDFSDTELLDEIRSLHSSRLDALAAELRSEHAGAQVFSTGGCYVCETCTYPDEPCRRPAEQRKSISAHGVDVAETCKQVGMQYDFENGEIRFIGMILW